MQMSPTKQQLHCILLLQLLPSLEVPCATSWVFRKLSSLVLSGKLNIPSKYHYSRTHLYRYPLYVGSFLSNNLNQNEAFVISAGAILGICAGLLWTAQGAIMVAYATEDKKGRYIGVFWAIFNLGTVIGGLISLIQNVSSIKTSVGDGTYIGFLALTLVGCVSSVALCKTERVIRSDGSTIPTTRQPTWKSELIGVWKSSAPSLPFFCSSPCFSPLINSILTNLM
jgi:MFS family permease